MFRCKKDVDRHVQDIFRKLKSENEQKLRCYNIAKLYYQVGDYETTKRYVSNYLEVRGQCAGAHKLLGQALEGLGQKEAALKEYITSLELEARQDELVLKVCELLTDNDNSMDMNRVRYWVERADKQFPHHPTVFQLKEKMLTSERPNDSTEDLEALIASELAARPTDVQLRVKLLKHYMSKQKLDDAYKHAARFEETYSHRNSIVWYQALSETLSLCKKSKESDWSFWVLYISSLERYAALALKEEGDVLSKSIPEATQAVHNFDQALMKFKSQNFTDEPSFTEHMLSHMWGQLNFHLVCLVLRKTKYEQANSETTRVCFPLLLTALHSTPIDHSSLWVLYLKDHLKKQVRLWHREGSYRCSQVGHVLQDFGSNGLKTIVQKFDYLYSGKWQQKIYNLLFTSDEYCSHISTSYFVNNIVPKPPLRICSQNELKQYDEVAEEIWPESLHHQVWLGLKSRPQHTESKESGPHPNQVSHVFRELQFSIYNLNQAAPDSLCRLDIDAFLNAAILCASAIIEEEKISDTVNHMKFPTLPADLTKTLCTSAQQKWWSAAYKMYSKQKTLVNDIGEIRHDLQRGLEVVRCIGNHGLHPVIIVHLARIFQHRAKLLKEKDTQYSNIFPLEARCELYWSNAVPLLERMRKNQVIRVSNSSLFHYQGKDMTDTEITAALEEGKLLLTQRFLRDKQYEQAIDSLQTLKCPEASFQQSQIYKTLADEIVGSVPRESMTYEMRYQHLLMLSQAKNCLYLTLDRLRSPGVNPKHPLNSELGTYIAEIENELKAIEPDLSRGYLCKNDCDGMSDESYSSAQSGVEQAMPNPLPTISVLNSSINLMNTSHRNTQRTPKQTSTPMRPQHHDILDLSRNRHEARPSPERLDAQIRQLIYSKDNMIQTIMDQHKAVLESNKAIMQKIEELVKEMAELRKETQRQRPQTMNVNPNLEEDLYVLGEEDYNELNYNGVQPGSASSLSGNMFTPTHRQTIPQWGLGNSPLVHPSATAFQRYYQGGMPYNDPNAQAVPSLYATSFYPMPMLYPNGSKMQENILQPGLFPSRVPTQLPDLMPPGNQPLQLPMQRADTGKPEMTMTIPPPSIPATAVPPPTIPPPTIPPQAIPPPTIPPQVIPPQVIPPQVIPPSAIPPQTMPQVAAPLQAMPPTTLPTSAISPAMPMNVQTTQRVPVVKDTPVNKVPPVNVVITTSDVLPTTAPPVQPTLSVTIPVQHRLGTIPASSTGAPHNYQLSMPAQPTIPTTVNLPSLATTLTTPSANIPTSATGTQKELKTNLGISTSASPNSSTEVIENEHDPLPDFAPVIPLPAEIKVTTGEENQEVLFSGRAKLYRFVEKDWKERGVGNIKLLKNEEGKVRLLMRRDQVLKICANHFLTREMELLPRATEEKAYTWAAYDFADEETKLETFCVRFKTVEEAATFKECFDKAKEGLPVSPTKPVEAADRVSSKADSTTESAKGKVNVQLNFGVKPSQKQETGVVTSTPSQDTAKGTVTTVGGFSFGIPTKLQPISTTDAAKGETPKPSPFANLNLSKSATSPATKTSTATTQPPSYSFGVKTTTAASSTFSVVSTTTTTTNTVRKTEGTTSTTSTPTSGNGVPLSQLFKAPVGSWQCEACYISNTAGNDSCIACDTPKDPSAPPKPKANTFQLKPQSTGGNLSFSFGIPQDTNKDSSSGFPFSLAKTNEKPLNNVSETPTKVDMSGAKFVFGMPQETPPKTNKEPHFTFGSPGKPFDFNFVAKSPGRGEHSEDEVVESEDIDFSPAIPMPDKVDVKTGEEEEEILYSHRAKLFRFDKTTKEWKERGLGDIKLLKHKETGKLRLVMRRDQILKLCLNHFVLPDLEIIAKDDKTWLWNAADFNNEETEYMQFACRFKTAEIAQEFKQAVDDARKGVKPSSAEETGKSSDGKEMLGGSESAVTDDIEIVYEAQPSDSEIAQAEQLKLPRNFYSYKQKPDCPGCRGCKEPEVPLFDNTVTPKSKSKSQKVKSPAKSETPVTSAVTTTSSPAPMFFGKSDNNKPDQKKTFNFASALPQQSTLANKQNVFQPENLKICSPNTSQTQGNMGSTQQNIFGMALMNTTTPASPNTSIFGGKATVTTENSFGVKPTNESSNVSSPGMKPILKPSSLNVPVNPVGSIFSNTFGQPKTTAAVTGTPTATFSFTKTPILGPSSPQVNSDTSNANTRLGAFSANSNITPFGSTSFTTSAPFSSKSIFGGSTNSIPSFGNNSVKNDQVAETKPEEQTGEKEEGVSFLSKNILTFSTLAAKAPQTEAFKKDPHFSFAGVGSTVFGSKSAGNVAKQNDSTSASKDKEGENEDDEGNHEGGEHDPHFEPVIPLPEAIEVRTGEEDEEKLFCERAKLYRFDTQAREWKERGVGEMKILHHNERGTYRLLLRREQVHKVVCNFLLTPDVNISKLASSESTYVWTGMNHIEGSSAVEQLAVRFKNVDIATKFKNTVTEVQQRLQETRREDASKPIVEEPNDDDGDGDDENEYDKDCEDEEEDGVEADDDNDNEDYDEDDADEYEDDDEREEDDENSVIFGKMATLVIMEEGEEKKKSIPGIVNVHYISKSNSYKIILRANETNTAQKTLSMTIIDGDMEMQVSKTECMWTALDYALQPPRRRTLKAIFLTSEAAEQMMKCSQVCITE